MSIRIQINDFSNAINELLDEYGDEVSNAMESAIKETANEATQKLKHEGTFNDITGAYRKNWKNKISKTNISVSAVVYNDKHYRLTHLLEFGHAKQNGGRTKAFPHISNVNDWVGNELIEKLERKLK